MNLLCFFGRHDWTEVGTVFSWDPALCVRACTRCPKIHVERVEAAPKPLQLSA